MGDAVDIRAGRLTPAEYDANFDELYPPLDRKRALVEASRCYFCHDAPCVEACPTSIDIPRFIRGIHTDNVAGAATTILEANIMGGACARVCPTEILCEGACVRTAQENKPVKIGLLQRYATDHLLESGTQPFTRAAPTGQRIAVVGAGPAGLACAHALARDGHDVVVFEKRPKGGGLNEYGIAAYKVPHGFAQKEVEFILGVGGIELRCGVALGRDIHLRDLRREFSAVFIGVGLGGVNVLGLPGEELAGVHNAVDYIARLRQADPASLPVGHDVVVIGGGNTAIDIAVQSRRLGATNVTIAYRRGASQMGATRHEQEVAQTNGVTIRHWTRPVRLIGEDDHVRAVELEYTQLGQTGRLMGTDDRFTLRADMVFKAIGQHLVPSALDGSVDLLEIERGKIKVNEDRMSSLDRVWAGGDAIGQGQDLTVQAVEDGKIAARAIHRYLMD
ncbi:NAD(P)-dependent oxidoreductase [Marinimicrococcus flavescens]|uniref:NAD(P)-dependent oxidoreductase n=1 Tax=Marinimicrococcus flavescens TaxID=3031815 RepID=A0AAP3UZL0_9PROT|nr:NAD(P)-dependent oxidoreductase [Marinimicrococcus flavescens]